MSDPSGDTGNFQIRRCMSCGTRNRVDRLRVESAVCSRCRAPLSAAPVDHGTKGHGTARRRVKWGGAIASTVAVVAIVALCARDGSPPDRAEGDTTAVVGDSTIVSGTAPASIDTVLVAATDTAESDTANGSFQRQGMGSPASYTDTILAIRALQDTLRMLTEPDSENVRGKHRADLIQETLERLSHLMHGIREHERREDRATPHDAGIPPLTRIGPAGKSRRTATITVRNDTEYDLTVIIRSTPPGGITIPPGGTHSIESPRGTFSVYASVNAPDVRPFFGSWTIAPGGYTTSFYISE
jgi:hypothetical protein